jgi:hypothetical protein
VQADAAPFLQYVLEPLIRKGFLAGIHSDLDTTKALLYNDNTSKVHITGSGRTHDAIVWGPPGVRA